MCIRDSLEQWLPGMLEVGFECFEVNFHMSYGGVNLEELARKTKEIVGDRPEMCIRDRCRAPTRPASPLPFRRGRSPVSRQGPGKRNRGERRRAPIESTGSGPRRRPAEKPPAGKPRWYTADEDEQYDFSQTDLPFPFLSLFDSIPMDML